MSVAQLSDDGEQSLFVAAADAPHLLDHVLEGLAGTLVNYSLLSRAPSVAVARGACPPHGIEATIRAYGCSIMWPAFYFDEGETYTVIAPTRDRLRQLIERLRDFGAAELESVAEVRPEALQANVRLGEVLGALTERQLDVLAAAVRAGYYASPRQTSTEALAAQFSVSRATFEEHLRKAEMKVLKGVMATLANHPLARTAIRSRSPITKPRGAVADAGTAAGGSS